MHISLVLTALLHFDILKVSYLASGHVQFVCATSRELWCDSPNSHQKKSPQNIFFNNNY